MSGYAFWDRLWEMHDETKSLISFNPKKLIRHFTKDHVTLAVHHQEKDVDLAEEIEEAPAEHIERIQTGPGGVDEGEPREYTMRQKIGLVLGPVLFLVMLFMPTPSGMEPLAQKMAAVACLMAT